MGLTGVLDHRNAAAFGDVDHRAKIRGPAIQVNWNDRRRALCDRSFERGRVDVGGLRTDVGTNRTGTGVRDGLRGGNERVRRRDDVVARPDTCGQKS